MLCNFSEYLNSYNKYYIKQHLTFTLPCFSFFPFVSLLQLMKFGRLGGFTFCAMFISWHFSLRKSYYESCGIQRDSKNMLTIQSKASSLCNYLLVIHCKNGLCNTLVKSILNCIKKILINCADPPLIWDGLSWIDTDTRRKTQFETQEFFLTIFLKKEDQK